MNGMFDDAGEDQLAELALIARIEGARARQQEGQARRAEARERALARVVTERRELRERAKSEQLLAAFLGSAPNKDPEEVIVLEAIIDEQEGR